MSWLGGLFHREKEGSSPVQSGGERPPSVSARTPAPERLTTLNIGRFLREHPRVVVDVWAPWCGPCRAFGPIFADAAHTWGEHVGFGKIHADHERSLVVQYGIRSIPSLLFFQNGELVRTEVGVLSRVRLDHRIRRVFRDLP